MRTVKRECAFWWTSAAVVALSGCLGDDPNTGEVNRAPRADAGDDREVIAGETVVLDAIVDGDGGVTVAWTQIDGPPVVLSSSAMARVELTAPAVTASTDVVLALRVTDGAGAVADDEITLTVRPCDPPSAVKHVILMIGDGMHLEEEMAYSRYRFGWDFGAVWHAFPYRNYVTTWDVTTYDRYAYGYGAPRYRAEAFDPTIGYAPDRGGVLPSPLQPTAVLEYFFTYLPRWPGDPPMIPFPDSASTATAIATGVKTEDGNIAWLPGDPPDGEITTLAEEAKAKKIAVGVASTVPFSHATPAAFVAHDPDRTAYHAIAADILHDFQPDVVIGAGHPAPLGAHRFLSQADYEGLVAHDTPPFDGYTFVERHPGVDGTAALAEAAEAAIACDQPLVGLFGGSHENNEQWVAADAPGAPAFTRPAIEDPPLAAIATATLQVLRARGGAHGFFAMIEGGDIDWAAHERDYAQLIATMYDFDEAVRAVIAFVDAPGDDVDWSNTLLIVTADHATGGLRLDRDPDVLLQRGDLPWQVPVPDRRIRHLYPDGEITWIAPEPGKHTNELVSVQARGAGLERFAAEEGAWYPGTRLLDDSQLHTVIAGALGL
jgi:alkaline phosphatase